MVRRSFLLLLTSLFACAALAQTSPGQLAATPPMGWNSWNHFAEKVSDAVVRQAADAMVSSGMRDAGYLYINIDDTWEGERDASGVIHTNSKFPDMKALADYVHGKGLKIGIYSSPGPKTCAGYEGSYGHEAQDAQTYAEWGIDYLKYDLCSFTEMMKQAPNPAASHQMMLDAYTKMHQALLKTGRPIVLSLCQYGWDNVWRWGSSVGGNLWRTTGDIEDKWMSMAYIGFGQNGQEKYAGPGHWNDPDMLEVGNGGMKHDEYLTHMSLWAMLAAPLLAGNDLSSMTPETVDILTNKEVIAIDQDPAGIQGHRVWQEGPLEIWMKPLKDGSRALALFNRNSTASEMTLRFTDAGLGNRATVRDLWQHKDLGSFSGTFTTHVPRHGVVLLRVKP
jgi:alpha-galactosidase